MSYRKAGTVEPEQAGLTVAQYLKGQGYTEHQIRHVKYIPQGILKNGAACRAVDVVAAGDQIQLRVENTAGGALPWTILYEDADAVVLQKNAGEVVHPAHGHYEDTIICRLQKLWACPVHIIGRLDKDTSGALMLAKNAVAAQRLQRQRQEGVLVRTYVAFVHGKMEPFQGTIDMPVQQKRRDQNRMQVVLDTKQRPGESRPLTAVTKYSIVETYSKASMLRLTIDTGRTHQIRVHLASIGHPLIGDPIYGNGAEFGMERTALHAEGIRWQQPFTQEDREVKAPLPNDLKELIRQLPHA